jgi:6-phosphogluconolactonase
VIVEHPIIRRTGHHVEIASEAELAERAADVFSTAINTSVAERGKCLVGLSGGSTPVPFFHALAARDLPWDKVTLIQVDERIAPDGSPDRNLTEQRKAFGPLSDLNWLTLPVHTPDDLGPFVAELVRLGGQPPILDIVHLGLGSDGHTASLVPGDLLVKERYAYVGRTIAYQGTERLSLTRAVLERARLLVYLVTGPDKADALAQLNNADPAIPAGLIQPRQSVIITTSDTLR